MSEPQEPAAIEDQYFDQAHEFVAALTAFEPTSAAFLGPSALSRGQGDSEWNLLPRILRPDQPLPDPLTASKTIFSGSLKLESDLVACEIELINLFCDKADDVGLSIPGDSLPLRGYLTHLASGLRDGRVDADEHQHLLPWPSASVISIFSLMQHCGIPTRLLDWSVLPITAAYFAAKQALTLSQTDGNIAVYVVDAGRVANWREIAQSDGQWGRCPESRELILVRPPTAGNENLINQKGRFTFSRRAMNDSIEPRAQESLLVRNDRLFTFFKRYLLPQTEAKELLYWLNNLGIHGGTLFPSWDGVAASVLERIEWRSPRE